MLQNKKASQAEEQIKFLVNIKLFPLICSLSAQSKYVKNTFVF